MKGLLTIEEIAAEKAVSTRTVRRWLTGVEPFAMMGKRKLYTPAQVSIRITAGRVS